MQMTVTALQTQSSLLTDALKRGESVELTFHGKILGTVTPSTIDRPNRAEALKSFLGSREDSSKKTVNEELRTIRQGRDFNHVS